MPEAEEGQACHSDQASETSAWRNPLLLPVILSEAHARLLCGGKDLVFV
jgi:hypothetical protein